MADGAGYLIEFQPVGGSVRVCAIDPQTGVEVTIVGSPSVSRRELSTLAVRKLEYVLKRGEGDGDADSPSRPGFVA